MSHTSEAPLNRITIPMLQQWKQEGRRIAMTTAYDAVTARIADPVVEILLVGDSVGNVCLGFDNTLPVSMAMMNHHLEAAARTKPRALLVADMPFLSFHLSPEDTPQRRRIPAAWCRRRQTRGRSQAGRNGARSGRLRDPCDGPSRPHPAERQRDGWIQGAGAEGR